MIAKPPHNRRLGLVGVALTKTRHGRVDSRALNEVRDELEQVIVESGYLANAPFWWVTVAVRFGLKNENVPHYQRINRKYSDLPLAVEVDTHRLIDASLEETKSVFREAVLKALIHAGEKYERPIAQLKAALLKPPARGPSERGPAAEIDSQAKDVKPSQRRQVLTLTKR